MPKDTALHKAAHQGEVATIEELIKSGEVDVNAPGAQERTALHRACGGNHVECLKVLIDLGANKDKADKAGRTPLHWAAIGGHADAVEFLLTLKVKLNEQTASGQTPLHSAVDGEKLDVVKLLIKQHETGAGEINFEITDKTGKTALELAKTKKDKEMIKMIQFKKVDVSKEGGACCIT